MKLPNKAQLRGTLRKLSALAGSPSDDHDRGTAAQEALDYLAMLVGIKPVFLLGRGFNDPDWIDGVRTLAKTQKLQIIEGPYWDACVGAETSPGWYLEYLKAAFAGKTAWYICRSRAAAEEVSAINETGRPTVEQEARLLGYPECCVTAHYERNLVYQKLWLDILARAADNDEDRMRRMLGEGAALQPETEDERQRLEAAMAVDPCPFTSINMCARCAGEQDSPARLLSGRYAELAGGIDKGLATVLSVRGSAG